jgi:hypothetical protein
MAKMTWICPWEVSCPGSTGVAGAASASAAASGTIGGPSRPEMTSLTETMRPSQTPLSAASASAR